MAEGLAYYANPRQGLKLSLRGEISNQRAPGVSTLALGDFDHPTQMRYLCGEIAESFSLDNAPSLIFEIDSEFEHIEKQRFCDSVTTALKEIQAGAYQKIVLARRKRLRPLKGNPLAPEAWIEQFMHPEQYGHQFLFKEQERLFLSLSPESLFERQGEQLRIDAIAGTTESHPNDQRNLELWQELAQSQKDRHEHDMVRQDIEERLRELRLEGRWVESHSCLRLRHIQHMMSRLEVKHSGAYTDEQLINALHPTAAVGGLPRDKTIKRIKELEGFDRGPYAAAFAVWPERERTLVGVGLRSCLVEGDQITLYAGAGVVAGSTPEKEWLETEKKCRNFL